MVPRRLTKSRVVNFPDPLVRAQRCEEFSTYGHGEDKRFRPVLPEDFEQDLNILPFFGRVNVS